MGFITVVLQIEDGKAAKTITDPLFDSLASKVSLPGCRVTAISLDDEITRIEQLEMED